MSGNDPAAAGGLSPGAKLGRYQVIRRLAVGGMAELYLARHVAVGGYQKVVAVKRVLAHLAEDAEFVHMFLNEARLAAGLDHSNIAHVIDFGSDGGEHFMAMEYVHGKNVHHLLKHSGGIPLPCALTIVREVAAALHYAHERAGPDGRPLGLVHRDVSPSNVLVSYDGDVKLVDFGIAKATAHTRATRTGTIKGKLGYMSPEQLKGETLDRRADVFSLGVVAYELTTGGRCFFAEGEFALINKVAAARFERPSSVVPGYPGALEEIIVRALAVDPAQRWPSAREVQLAIEAFASGEGISLSKVALSDHLRRVFGHEDYPKTDAISVPTAVATPDRSRTRASYDPSVVRQRRRRITAGWVVGALAAGLVLGLGAQKIFGDDEPAPVPEPSAVAAPPAVVETPAESPSPAEEEQVIVLDDDESEAPQQPASRPRPRRKPRKPKPKAAKVEPPPSPSGKKEYLPPSRRGAD